MPARLWGLVTLGLALMLGQSALAQTANPVLKAQANGIRDAAHERGLRLRRLDLSVEQRGSVVETTLTASFANPEPERLEGDFRLTLPEGAVVTGYALDIGAQMVDGVLVDRPRAKAVYEARVRQRIDPNGATLLAARLFRNFGRPNEIVDGVVIELKRDEKGRG